MSAVLGKANGGEDEGSASGGDPIEELRRLLLVAEQSQVAKIQERLDDPEIHAEDVSRVLPEAIALRAAKDRDLPGALQPMVEEAILTSVRRDPHVLVEALFPVMGPAIRKSIASALASMLESLNQTLERSFSAQGLAWRWEAWRTGKPFAEVVLLRTLVYRVEQVFLIHRRTGLLLQHVSTRTDVQDADMVSGMLTAIRDFVQDSFGGRAEQSLDKFRVGELTVQIEQGPEAILAAVVRGNPPPALSSLLAETVEAIHLEQAEALPAFEGDAHPFEKSRPRLEACLKSQQRPGKERPPGARTARARKFLLAALAVVLIGAAAAAFLSARAARRWEGYLARLTAEPGIVVVDSGRRDGRYFVSGLRDPLARDPAAFLAESGIDGNEVTSEWKPYQALHPIFLAARARRVLEPPPTVVLRAADGVVVASGSAPQRWIEEARARSRAFSDVARYEDRDVAGAEQRELEALAAAIEGRHVSFQLSSAELSPAAASRVEELVRDLSRLASVARSGGRTVHVEITGRGDSTGTEEANLGISRRRAERVARALRAGDPALPPLVVRGVGSSQPLGPEVTEEDRRLNRSVTVSVVLEPVRQR